VFSTATKWLRSRSFLLISLAAFASAQTPSPQTSPATPATPAVNPVGEPNGAGSQTAQPSMPGQESATQLSTPQAGAPAANDSANPNNANASAETDNDTGMFVFKKEVEEVMLHATVIDDQRRPVPGLERTAFSVFENGVSLPVTSFRRQDVPVAMGIVIDSSGSMRDKRDEVSQAVLNLIRASNPQDEIFVVNFSKNYYLDQDFTSDVNLLQTAMHQVSSTGSTALYDAIVASAVHLMNNPRLDKKVLLVITDGQDNMSQETLEEASRRLQRANGPTLYAIGLTGGDMKKEGRDALLRLAQNTGGVAYFPDSLNQVQEITRTVAHDIRSQYLIAYKPRNQNVKPGDRSVKVEAHAPGYGALTVQTRSAQHYGDTPARLDTPAAPSQSRSN
jgi:Ca-activated chloride channel family protein